MVKPITDYNSLWQKWVQNAKDTPDKDAVVHWRGGEEPLRWSFNSLISQATRFASFLKKMNVEKGDVCAIIMHHNFYFYPLYLAVSSIGAIPAVLAYPNPRLHPDKFRQGIEGMSQRSGLDYILTERSIENVISPLIEKNRTTIRSLIFPLEWLESEPTHTEFTEQINDIQSSVKPSDPVLLQHSSGTTGLQKPVLLSHSAVLQHIKNYSDAIGLTSDDKIISWLPLYHDMGLIAAFHLPLAYGITTVQIDPFEWVLAPALLLEAISKEKGTLMWLPNFAYNILADKIHDDEMEGLTLESLRLTVNCSEPVRIESHEKFINRFVPYGLNPQAISACYAMAETTFAVTQSKPSVPVKVLSVDRQEFSKGKIKPLLDHESTVKMCVSSGVPIEGCHIKIVGENREALSADSIGEIAIHSVSMFDGYRNYPEKTSEVLKDGWYYSGDYGFVHEDHCYVIGRKKDIIIVAGNNLYPEDIELTASQVDGVIPGRVVAFGEEDLDLGSEQVSIAAETNLTDAKELHDLRMKIIKACMQIDVSIRKVYLVPPRWLIKSSAGKPSRKANKERIQSGKEENIWS
ncbi:MAG: AMP-binding protein [Syntrophothermus sp.]